MEYEFETPTRDRHPTTALLLSLAAPGLGHVYGGKFQKGLVLLVSGLVLGPLGLFAFVPVASLFRIAAIVAAFGYTALLVYAGLDARRNARDNGKGYALRDYNRPVVYALLALLAVPAVLGWGVYVREAIVQAFSVPTASMYPTIRPGDRVFTDKIAYSAEPVRRGDIVVFPNPDKRYQYNIKRVVAVAGDTVEVRGGKVVLNGKALDLTDQKDAPDSGDPRLSGTVAREVNQGSAYPILLSKGDKRPEGVSPPDMAPLKVPHGHCFVLGDNRHRTLDSRTYGPIPLADLVGRVDSVFFPRFESVIPR